MKETPFHRPVMSADGGSLEQDHDSKFQLESTTRTDPGLDDSFLKGEIYGRAKPQDSHRLRELIADELHYFMSPESPDPTFLADNPLLFKEALRQAAELVPNTLPSQLVRLNRYVVNRHVHEKQGFLIYADEEEGYIREKEEYVTAVYKRLRADDFWPLNQETTLQMSEVLYHVQHPKYARQIRQFIKGLRAVSDQASAESQQEYKKRLRQLDDFLAGSLWG